MNERESDKVDDAKQEESAQQTTAQHNKARAKAAQADYQPEYDRPSRRPSEDRPNAFNGVAWMVEGATGLAEELRRSDLGLSEDFWVHVYAMRREGLLAARAAIDSLLAKTEQESREATEQIKREARRGEVIIK